MTAHTVVKLQVECAASCIRAQIAVLSEILDAMETGGIDNADYIPKKLRGVENVIKELRKFCEQ